MAWLLNSPFNYELLSGTDLFYFELKHGEVLRCDVSTFCSIAMYSYRRILKGSLFTLKGRTSLTVFCSLKFDVFCLEARDTHFHLFDDLQFPWLAGRDTPCQLFHGSLLQYIVSAEFWLPERPRAV
jgi:hypothetical protein